MNKGKFILFFAIFEIFCLILLLFFNIYGFKLGEIWFSICSMFIGIYALMYSFLYKLDSSLFYGVFLIAVSVCSAVQYLLFYNFSEFYPFYILCFAIANFAVFVCFRQNLHFKLFAILSIGAILLISYKANIIGLNTVLVIGSAFLVMVVIDAVMRIKRNLRSVK